MALVAHAGKPRVDLSRYELTLNGRRVKLERQPMDLLILLAQKRGELVTRKEIIDKLWGKDVFVDVDGSINSAVRKIRTVLSDDPASPKFLETVVGKGYRFIGEIDVTGTAPGVPQTLLSSIPAGTIPVIASAYRSRALWIAVGLVLLVSISIWGWMRSGRRSASSALSGVRSIAVLPFENLSGDANQDYVVDGIADFLTTDLSKIHRLRITSRTSASHYRKTSKTVPEIARELGVDAVVEGSFVRSGNRVRVTAQLIDARSDRHLWANHFEREASDLLALESDLAHAVAREIAIELTPEEEASFASGRTVNPDAWDSYVKGRYFYSKQTRAGYQQSCQYFEQAIAADPGFALGHAGLAECTWQMGSFGLLSQQDGTLKAKAEALKAVELDTNSSEAHVALGSVLLYGEWDWAGAQKELSRALELNPSNAHAHSVYALYQWAIGNKEEAIAELKRSKELDPLNPGQIVNLGWRYRFAGHDDLAEREFREALILDPNSVLAHRGLGEIYALRKMYSEAGAEQFTAFSHSSSEPPELANDFLKTFKEQGYPAAHQFILKYFLTQAQERFKQGKSSATCELGVRYAEIGDKKNALDWMEKGLDEHCRQMMDVKSDPRYDFLRNEPRFNALLRRMNLESLSH